MSVSYSYKPIPLTNGMFHLECTRITKERLFPIERESYIKVTKSTRVYKDMLGDPFVVC